MHPSVFLERLRKRTLRTVSREVGGFASTGAIAFAVQLGLFNLLMLWRIGPLSANAIAVIVSSAVAYLGNRYVTFAHRRAAATAREAGLFFVVNAVTFALTEAVLSISYLVGAQHDASVINMLNVIGLAFGTVVRFVCYRRLVFVHAEMTPDANAMIDVEVVDTLGKADLGSLAIEHR